MTGPKTRVEVDEAVLERFKSAWAQGRPEPIEPLLPAEDESGFLPTLEELVGIELESAWKSWGRSRQGPAGEPLSETIDAPPQLESYLQRFPRLSQPEILRRLIGREHSLRKQCGQGGSIEEYRRRFPELSLDEQELESGLPLLSACSTDGRLADTLARDQAGGRGGAGIPPGNFGNYELLEEIGRGGMGIVYRARQRDADRIVALKVIRRDRLDVLPLDTQTTAIDRFRHEAQAAARLEHEHIVTVYEVGEVDGQPFFSMRYVEGRSLAEMVKDGPLENRRAARYMEPVCRAVHEAHCLGILHRDLKPQNIPVDSKTDRALVADFGLAKLSEGNEALTRAGEVMGTPQYMSPEQARDSANVRAETDVYGLGATLYHILTGRPPFQAATPLETLRQVMDEEPAPPRQVNPSIDRDLETICLKCLQKEPARRYATAGLLADDLRRYLDGEPILARPIGVVGRTWRWCRRNPLIALWVALAATFLVLALVATAVGYARTRAALLESERSFNQLFAAVDQFFTEVGDDTLLNQPGMQPLRRKLLSDARAYYEQFERDRGDDPKIRDVLAQAHYRVGRINELIETPAKALESYNRARKMQEDLLAERPTDQERLKALGDTLNKIGTNLVKEKNLDGAREAYQEAINVRRQLTQLAPEEPEFQRTLANSYMNTSIAERQGGQFDKALRQLDEAQKIRVRLLEANPDYADARRDLGMGYFSLAQLALARQDYAAAKENFAQATAAFEKLHETDPANHEYQARLTVCYRLLADVKSETGEGESALGLYEKALGLMKRLAADNPAVPSYQADLAGLHMNLGQLQRDQAHPAAALDCLQEARAILGDLVEKYPDGPEYRRDYAVTLWAMAEMQLSAGQIPAARQNLETAQKHLRELVRRFPGDEDFKHRLEAATAALAKLERKDSQTQ